MIVTPCSTYHIKLAIGDAGDGAYDSGVFLEANSFSATGLMVSSNFSSSSHSYGSLIEGCNDATVYFELVDPLPDPYIVRFNFLGTAVNGTDYTSEQLDMLLLKQHYVFFDHHLTTGVS